MTIETTFFNAELLSRELEGEIEVKSEFMKHVKTHDSVISVISNNKNVTNKITVLKAKDNKVEELENKIQKLEEEYKKNSKPKIFVVYGHDKKLKKSIKEALIKWQFEPLFIEDDENGSEDIIKKLKRQINSAEAGIVIATADDIGYKSGNEGKAAERWRQNVVFELGMLVMGVGLENTYILSKRANNVELPSDIAGLLRISNFSRFSDIEQDLLKKLFKYHVQNKEKEENKKENN